jgi:DNA-binding IclR family transcriptional regulator
MQIPIRVSKVLINGREIVRAPISNLRRNCLYDEAAEICGLSKSQAYRLLKRLADQGILRQMGGDRGTYYEGWY